MRRALAIVIGAAALLAGGAFLAFYLTIVQPIGRALAPATAQNARVHLVAEGVDALILTPFVTGDVPRLVRGEALQRLRDELWFTANADAGNVIGAVLLGLGGLPPFTPIATTFRAGLPLTDHSCITVGCLQWPSTQQGMWGMGRLRGMGEALGPPVTQETRTFTDHAAYLAAHAAVAADPRRWFATPRDHALQPPSDGLRTVTVSLPTRLVQGAVPNGPPLEDAAMQRELEALARDLLDGTGGRLLGIQGTQGLVLWAMKEGRYLRTADGGTRALPDLAQANPVLHLSVPHAQVSVIERRVRARAWPAPERGLIEAAIARAFRLWGKDGACLPGCASVTPTHPLQDAAEVSITAEPFWTLGFWVLPADR